MPASAFHEAMLYEQVEPFGDRRRDVQAGIIAATIANVNRGKDIRPYKVTEFMMPWDPVVHKPQTPEQQMKILLALQQIQNAKTDG